MPANVRHAVDVAYRKQEHSDFYYKLLNLNDKVLVFKNVFYSNMPAHQRQFYERKRREYLEKQAAQKLKEQEILKKYRASKNKKKKATKENDAVLPVENAVTVKQMMERIQYKFKLTNTTKVPSHLQDIKPTLHTRGYSTAMKMVKKDSRHKLKPITKSSFGTSQSSTVIARTRNVSSES